MLSLRLKTIADLVPKNSNVIDIGTDHAYLPIYLYQNNITNNITASDVSPRVLKSSYENLKKYNLENKIPLILSNGFNNIKKTFDIAIIAGMGAHTIKTILNNSNIPNILIIQSNNDHYELRKYLNSLNYKIAKEIAIKDKKHYYIIIKYIKEKETLTNSELLFGKSNNINYFNYLKEKYQDLYNKSHNKLFLDYIKILNNLIEKIPVNY